MEQGGFTPGPCELQGHIRSFSSAAFTSEFLPQPISATKSNVVTKTVQSCICYKVLYSCKLHPQPPEAGKRETESVPKITGEKVILVLELRGAAE